MRQGASSGFDSLLTDPFSWIDAAVDFSAASCNTSYQSLMLKHGKQWMQKHAMASLAYLSIQHTEDILYKQCEYD